MSKGSYKEHCFSFINHQLVKKKKAYTRASTYGTYNYDAQLFSLHIQQKVPLSILYHYLKKGYTRSATSGAQACYARLAIYLLVQMSCNQHSFTSISSTIGGLYERIHIAVESTNLMPNTPCWPFRSMSKCPTKLLSTLCLSPTSSPF